MIVYVKTILYIRTASGYSSFIFRQRTTLSSTIDAYVIAVRRPPPSSQTSTWYTITMTLPSWQLILVNVKVHRQK